MPNSAMFAAFLPPVLIGAGMLMFMDASINVAMEPFRALVADMLPEEQSTTGFSVQTFLIGIGAVIGSWLPYVLLNWLGIGQGVTAGGVPMNVVISFIAGAVVLIVSILWTVVFTKEYSPQQMAAFHKSDKIEKSSGGLSDIFISFKNMPQTMRQLAWVQFFSWIGLFGMWVYTTPAVAQHFYHTTDAQDPLFQQAGDWVGILFGVYNAVAMIVALLLIPIAKKIGQRKTHAVNLTIGAIGLISIFFIPDSRWLILPMIGIGIAWASILAMPYAMLAPSLPAGKMGVYMGIFNFFITVPQIINALFSGYILKYVFNLQSVYMLVLSGVFLLIASVCTLRIKKT
jgi:maltose/moltooligosaccharide transporter